MEPEVLNPQQAAGSRKGGSDTLRVVRKNALGRLGLCLDERPRLGRVFEPEVIPVLSGRVLRVSHQARSIRLVVVTPLEPADFSFPTRRGNGEIHDGLHGNLSSPIPTPEVFSKPSELFGARPASAPPGLANQPKLAAGSSGLLNDFRVHGKLLDPLGGTQHDADPDQVVEHGRRACALSASGLHMPDQVRAGQCVRLSLA